MQLMHVLAVGKNDVVTSAKRIDGFILNPNNGSSSVDVAKWRTHPRVISPLLPAAFK